MSKVNLITRTGRVQSWMDDPTSRYPVSCTVFVVEDSCEGPNGIEASWKFCSKALRFGAGVAVHLSKLRPAGTTSPIGLIASGPTSFAKIYSVLNEVLRRGGTWRSGAITLHLDADHADLMEYIQTPRSELPWVKRCVDINSEMWEALKPETREALLQGIRSGDIWLCKVKHDANGERLYFNVCLEIALKHRASCLLEHVNLGACEIEDIQKAFFQGMDELILLHGQTGVGASGEYLSPEEDRQVGLGMLGLANLLKRYKVSYAEFGEALDAVNNRIDTKSTAVDIAKAIKAGLDSSAVLAEINKMDRAFTIAPTATCSYNSKDLDGYTCAPEIAPPIGRSIDRDSGQRGVETYEYGDVEIASEVGWDAYKRVADGLMTMMNNTGLLHGYSFNSWSDVVTYNDEFVEEWLQSPQTSLYYSVQVMANTQDKTDIYSAIDWDEADGYLQELLKEDEPCSMCAE